MEGTIVVRQHDGELSGDGTLDCTDCGLPIVGPYRWDNHDRDTKIVERWHRDGCPTSVATLERKVLVGRHYGSLSQTWTEWKNDKTFRDVIGEIGDRRSNDKLSAVPDQIIEVIVVRRASVRGELTVDVETLPTREEAP